MKAYKVETCRVREAESLMNEMAQAGWRVISTMPNHGMGYGMVIIFEKEA